MPLTQTDLTQIRSVMDESIAAHPKFDQQKMEIIREVKSEVVDEISEVLNDALAMIDKRFDIIEHRLDNLRIVTR